jgi:hypothetical protein
MAANIERSNTKVGNTLTLLFFFLRTTKTIFGGSFLLSTNRIKTTNIFSLNNQMSNQYRSTETNFAMVTLHYTDLNAKLFYDICPFFDYFARFSF